MFYIDDVKIKYLPYSGKRYAVGLDGSIYDNLGNRLSIIENEEQYTVKLCWLNGSIEYNVGMLVIVTFQPMYLPEHLWIRIEPLYLDSDISNNVCDNLRYRFFDGLLEYEEVPGYFHIPLYTRYVINRHGEMLTASNGREKTWNIVKACPLRNSKGGYAYTRTTNDPGVNNVLLKHRALCYTFKAVESAEQYNQPVNHINGIPGDDRLDNIEWSSILENNRHAIKNRLTGSNVRKVLSRNVFTGEVKEFSNTRALAKSLNLPDTRQIRYRLIHAPDVLFDDDLQFKYKDDCNWIDVDKTVPSIKCKVGSKMAARNVHTGKIVIFDTYDEGSAKTGVDKQTIAIHIRDGQIIPFHGYNFNWCEEGMEWPIHSEINLLAYSKYPSRTPDPIMMTNVKTNEIEFFESRNELAIRLSISKSYATQLTSQCLTYLDTYKLEYYKLRDNVVVPLGWKT